MTVEQQRVKLYEDRNPYSMQPTIFYGDEASGNSRFVHIAPSEHATSNSYWVRTASIAKKEEETVARRVCFSLKSHSYELTSHVVRYQYGVFLNSTLTLTSTTNTPMLLRLFSPRISPGPVLNRKLEQ